MTPDQELESLLAARTQRELTEPERARLNDLLRDDDLLEEALDQLEVDAMLRWRFGSITPGPAAPATHRRPWRALGFVAAAAALIAVAVYPWLFAPVEPAPAEGWQVDATGNARYERVSPTRIHLTRGEIAVRSIGAVEPLTIETSDCVAETAGTRFLIGTHPYKPKGGNVTTTLTRVLVLAGAVTLTNALGSATAEPAELAVAAQGKKPTKGVARSTNHFGFDLYRELRKDGKNLFFSPFSIASVLAMAAEGARGRTAEEITRVLRLPATARRIGDDAQRIPLELAKIHTGFAVLTRLLNAASDPTNDEIRRQMAELQQQLAPIRADLDRASKARDWNARGRARRAEERLVGEINALSGRIKDYRLAVANSIWAERSYPLAKQFAGTIKKSYDTGAVVPADFKHNAAGEIDRINEWVEDHTGGKIPSIVGPDSINDLTRLVLLDAIYFQAQWLTPFDTRWTKPEDFTTAAGATTKVPMMRRHGLEECRYGAFEADGSPFATPSVYRQGQTEGLYPGAGGFEILELPYRGHDLAMVVLLPRDAKGLGALEDRLTAGSIDRWLKQVTKRETHVFLPRFRAESSFELSDALAELGMPSAFVPPEREHGADFSGMTDSSDPADRLHVNKVIHKAFISVDEKGTEAAAVSAMMFVAGAAAPDTMPFIPTFRADRPFVYLIRDLRTGAILFLGRVVEP